MCTQTYEPTFLFSVEVIQTTKLRRPPPGRHAHGVDAAGTPEPKYNFSNMHLPAVVRHQPLADPGRLGCPAQAFFQGGHRSNTYGRAEHNEVNGKRRKDTTKSEQRCNTNKQRTVPCPKKLGGRVPGSSPSL